MKLQFKHQKFQEDAAKAVVDVFQGQPYLTPTYMIDSGYGEYSLFNSGWGNQKIIPALSEKIILEQLQKIQRSNNIKPSEKLEGKYNLTIEMETGVGKTYAYIKTMYELNKHYGWSKFIVVVPSIAIREGVYKSFEITEEHFAEEYGKKIHYFIYNSTQLTEIDRFASDNSINVMIINSQAFNATGKDARRIYMKLDEFRSRRPIDIIAKTNPILIIDEPQSVEGEKTKKNLKEFSPLLTLRYSATHKKDSIYNMVYRLDAMDAYNKKLVKKIAVKGISQIGTTATEGFVYLESINLSKSAPTATIQYEYKGANGVRKVTRIVNEGFDLYENSGEMEEYKNGFVISSIDGRDNSVEFINGKRLYLGDVIGNVSEEHLRRIQIRETILTHIEREKELFHKNIKVLSLFFIDEVAKYKQYDSSNNPFNGIYADMFEEEYSNIIDNLYSKENDSEYLKYINSISPQNTHAGYFSIDKKGKMIDSKLVRKETTTDDVDAYDLIMKNKELLLDRDPYKSPVRFIFSHSALREGWDNPNVFQICTLKQSSSETRKRQEVGRGLRLSVNQDGVRMDSNVLGEDIHNVNVLTVIASESYDNFAKGLQSEIADAIAERPMSVNVALFENKVIKDSNGLEQVIDTELANAIYEDLIANGYIKKGKLTDKYYEDKKNGNIVVADEVSDSANSIIEILDSIYDPKSMMPENARSNNIELNIDKNKLQMSEFKELWKKINTKSIYMVDFKTEELVSNAIVSLNKNLHVDKVLFKIQLGTMEQIKSKNDLLSGSAFSTNFSNVESEKKCVVSPNSNIKYDLIGKLVDETGLTRKTIIQILQGIDKKVFDQFKDNPEDFIIKAASIINDEKATAIVEHITYNALEDKYDLNVFTDSTIKGRLDINALKTKKHIYDHVVYDSENEKEFVKDLDKSEKVAVYVKLPKLFFIRTPVGKYNPDWAIAFNKGEVKHIYFVAETKGSMNSMELRSIEKSKIDCAKKHFEAISNNNVVYNVVDSFDELLKFVM